jgi:biopolymer transport protein ExbB
MPIREKEKTMKRISMKILVAAILAAGVTVPAQENYRQWSRHEPIHLNTEFTGAAVSEDQVRFPVLVRLTSANAATFAASINRGADLRFTKLDTVTRLAHQIERWDSTGQVAEIWVLADTVKGNTVRTLVMHTGRSGVADSSNGRAVFDTAHGYIAVFHLNEAGDTAVDATANGFKAVAAEISGGGLPTAAAGQIGRGREFNGSGGGNNSAGGYYEIPNSASGPLNLGVAGTYSIAAWAYPDGVSANNHNIVSKGDHQYELQINWEGGYEMVEYTGAQYEYTHNGSGGAAATTWMHLVGVRQGNSTTLFVDGQPNTNLNIYAPGTVPDREETQNVYFGRTGQRGGSDYLWDGKLDEIQISKVARTDAWAALAYANQRTGQTFVTIGGAPPSALRGAGSRVSANDLLGVKSSGNGLAFRLNDASLRDARVTVLDLGGRTLWSASVTQNGEAVWQGKAGSPGVYVVRLKARDAHGATLSREHAHHAGF